MRRLAILVLSLSLTLPLARCACDDAPPGGGEGEGEGDAFDVWREMQAMLRASADHRAARAAALVEAGDVDALFAFVRDEIALVPGSEGFYASDSARRWGTRATLRGGMGTMRERADLLAELIAQTGRDAAVWSGAPAPGFDLEVALAHAPVRAVTWELDDATRARWRAHFGLDDDAARVPLDADGAVTDAIADTLLAHTLPVPAPLDVAVTAVPFVRVTDGAASIDLNPNVGPDAQPGEAHALDPAPAPDAGTLDTVTVRLEAARAQRPQEAFLLVEKTWEADALVGRTVTAAFAPPLSFAQAAATSIADVDTLVPMLVVRGADVARDERAALSALGAPITRGGEALTVSDDGALAFDDGAVAQAPTDAALLAAVMSASARADAATFPVVSLEVSARDAADAQVSDLAADAFVVREDGVEVQAHLRRTLAAPPRVVLLFDRSASIPSEFLDGASTIGHDIAQTLFAAVPGVAIQVGGIDLGAPTMAGGFSTDLAGVDDALTQLAGSGSEVWINLAALALPPDPLARASLIVCISDFDAEDTKTEDIAAALAAGPPVLAVGVGVVNDEVAQAVAAASDGAVVPVTDSATLDDDIAALTLERARYDYRLVYRSRAAGGVHDVSVGIDGERVLASASFTAPDAPARPPALSGLFLTIETRGRSVRRTLAGTEGPDVTDAHVRAVDAMLFGRAVLGVEAGAPSLSQKLDELIEERFVFEPLVDALVAGDDTALRAALAAPRTRTPARLRFSFSSGPDEATGPVTYPNGVQLALAIERPSYDAGFVEQLDLLPVVERRTALLDPTAARDATVRRTAYLGALEALTYPMSTHTLLDGEALAPVDPLTVDTDLGPQWLAPLVPYRDDYTILAPVDGDPLAFWAVHTTGGVLGGLADGSGGGIESEVEQMLNEIDVVLDAAERAGEMIGFEGITVWVELERLKAALVGNATIIIAGGQGSDPLDIVEDAACNAIEDAMNGAIPGMDDASGPLDDVNSLWDLGGVLTGAETPPDLEMPGVSLNCD